MDAARDRAECDRALVTEPNISEELVTYLNDHLAGSVAAIELLEHLLSDHEADRFGKFLTDLRDQVQEDQDTLRALIRRLGAEQSAARKASAWLLEKFTRVKLGSSVERSGLLQALEALALGITGKELLWRSLKEIAAASPKLQGMDFAALEKRAQEQFQMVESERLLLSREVLSTQEQS